MTAGLETLLAEFWERREGGEDVTAEQFAAAHPEHAEALRTALAAMLRTEAMLPGGDGPKAIGGYRVERRLGRGASGEVFAVTAPDGRRLALKRLLPHVATVARAQQRFQREARILGGLRHPGIVTIVDCGEDAESGGLPFLVMERVDGAPLGDWLETVRRSGSPDAGQSLPGPGSSWQRLARLGAEMADALAVAHTAGVLHRDLKPGNVLLRSDGTPVLIDFGLAAEAAAATLTGTGDVLGTPHYMAPEQARGEAAQATSDIHALGAILYELLTLVPPRRGADAMQVLATARRQSPPPPRSVVAQIPRELDLIVRRAMAFRAQHRYRTAAELAAALHLVADGGRPIGLTLGAGLRLDEFWRRRKRTVVALAAAAALLVAVVLVQDTWAEARVARVRAATVAATEAHFDGDAAAVLAHADTVGLGEPMLVPLLRRDDLSESGDDFARAMHEGWRKMPTNAKDAMSAFERAVVLRPTSSLAVGWYGIAAARGVAADVAERELLSAVRALPSSVRLRVELSRVLRNDRVKKAAAAVPHMRHAVTLPRADADTWHELAKALSKDRQDAEALAAIEQALQLAPESARRPIVRTKALLLDALARYEEAIPLLRSILDEAPGSDSWTSYGAMLDRTHRLREAAEAYRQALAMDPAHVPALLNLVHLHTGSDCGKCERCRACFDEDPALLDLGAADQYALEALRAEEGRYATVELLAADLQRAGAGTPLLAAIEERLGRDLPAEPLGRLVRARKLLQPR